MLSRDACGRDVCCVKSRNFDINKRIIGQDYFEGLMQTISHFLLARQPATGKILTQKFIQEKIRRVFNSFEQLMPTTKLDMEQLQSYKHLESNVNSDSSIGEEIQHRITLGNKAYYAKG